VHRQAARAVADTHILEPCSRSAPVARPAWGVLGHKSPIVRTRRPLTYGRAADKRESNKRQRVHPQRVRRCSLTTFLALRRRCVDDDKFVTHTR